MRYRTDWHLAMDHDFRGKCAQSPPVTVNPHVNVTPLQQNILTAIRVQFYEVHTTVCRTIAYCTL